MAGQPKMALNIRPMMALPPLIFAALAVMFYFGMNRDDPRNLRSTREGQPAPALHLSDLGSSPAFTVETLRDGRVKLVNFWASWCTPCRVEHPQLQAMADAGVVIFGINYKDDPEHALGFLDDLGDPFMALAADPNGRTAIEWGVYGVPETFVIDGNGIVTLRFAGPITQTIMENIIRPALAAATTD